MASPRGKDGDGAEANIWPAVTDSILLMASIFIVLAVASLVSIAQKVDDKAGEGIEPGEKLICKTVSLSANFLFDAGKANFKDSRKARTELKARIKDLQQGLEGLRRYARQQKDWTQGYYLVLEVAGHTDLDPIGDQTRSGVDRNWELSGERAITVVHEVESILRADRKLREDFRVRLAEASGPASQIQAETDETVLRVAGYSSHVPVSPYPNAPRQSVSDDVKETNRRVELRLYAQPTYVVKSRSAGTAPP